MPNNTKEPKRLTNRCMTAMTKAVGSFSSYLEECDAEIAAAIVADLIKFQLSKETDPQEDIEEILRRLEEEDEKECCAKEEHGA